MSELKNFGKIYGLPIDFDSLPEYVRFRALLRTRYDSTIAEFLAGYIYVKLWQQLAYMCLSEPLGCLPKSDWETYGPIICNSHMEPDQLIQDLLKSQLLYDHDAKYYFSTRFFLCNDQLAAEFRMSTLRGADARLLSQRQKHIRHKLANDLAKLIYRPTELDDRPVTPEILNRAIMFIRNVDAILMLRPPRGLGLFPEGLINDSIRFQWMVEPKFANFFIYRLQRCKGSPTLPRTTEQILGNIRIIMDQIEPEVGWGNWKNVFPYLHPGDAPQPTLKQTNYLLNNAHMNIAEEDEQALAEKIDGET